MSVMVKPFFRMCGQRPRVRGCGILVRMAMHAHGCTRLTARANNHKALRIWHSQLAPARVSPIWLLWLRRMPRCPRWHVYHFSQKVAVQKYITSALFSAAFSGVQLGPVQQQISQLPPPGCRYARGKTCQRHFAGGAKYSMHTKHEVTR